MPILTTISKSIHTISDTPKMKWEFIHLNGYSTYIGIKPSFQGILQINKTTVKEEAQETISLRPATYDDIKQTSSNFHTLILPPDDSVCIQKVQTQT